ncbi:hypothetical protein JXA88_12220, partial [Candidatus Fermentibacteria bacterium]|nr:hypothetical protein [Candidatus Fermentibacteria bacterium]
LHCVNHSHGAAPHQYRQRRVARFSRIAIEIAIAIGFDIGSPLRFRYRYRFRRPIPISPPS